MHENSVNNEIFDPFSFVRYVSLNEKNAKTEIIRLADIEVPVLSFNKGFFKYGSVLPFGLYSNVKSTEQLTFLLDDLKLRKFDTMTLNIEPFSDINADSASKLAIEKGYKLSMNQCHVLNTNRNIEEIIESFNSTRKKHIKRYQKAEQITIFQTNDPIYFEKYYSLYLDSIIRWGSKSIGYDREFIKGLYTVPGIKMWVAEHEGKMISGMICIYYQKHVFDWLAASIINEKVKKMYAAVAIQFEVIKHASECGLEYVNMGSSVNLNGVSDFKDSWGAQEYNTFTFNKQSLIFRLLKIIFTNLKKLRR